MFEALEVANKEYEDLKAKYDELVIAKNGADEKIKTYEEGNKNYEDEIKLNKEISETENRLKNLKKILYRLKVCERILNNEEELF